MEFNDESKKSTSLLLYNKCIYDLKPKNNIDLEGLTCGQSDIPITIQKNAFHYLTKTHKYFFTTHKYYII